MPFSFFQRKTITPSQTKEKKEKNTQKLSFVDNRYNSSEISDLQNSIDNSDNSQSITQLQEKVDNKTGMPDDLKQGVENLSGEDMSDVKVTYNSDKPAQLQAHAYAQGTDIHIASGQEKHLPHEAWHVAQQKQGRVQPTTQVNGAPINNNNGLESEADKMGQKALQLKSYNSNNLNIAQNTNSIFQLKGLPPVDQVHEVETGKVVDPGTNKKKKSNDKPNKSEGLLNSAKRAGKSIVNTGKGVNETVKAGDEAIGNDGQSGMSDGFKNQGAYVGKDGQAKMFGGEGDDDRSVAGHERFTGKGLEITADILAQYSGLIRVIRAAKDLASPDDAEGWELILNKTESALEVGQGMTKATEGAVKTAGHFEEDSALSTELADVGNIVEGVSSGFEAAKSFLSGIKGSIKMFQDITSEGKKPKKSEIAKVIQDAADCGKASMNLIKTIENATGGASSETLASISGMDIITNTVDCLRQIHGIYDGSSVMEDMDEQMSRYEEKYKKLVKKINKEKHLEIKGELDERAEVNRKIVADLANKDTYKTKEETVGKKEKSDKEYLEKRVPELKEIVEEYALAKEIYHSKVKTKHRILIKIFADIMKITGSTLTLSGVGAVAGGATKGAGAATELMAAGARNAKQNLRDNQAKGGKLAAAANLVGVKADISKTTAAKKEWRIEQGRVLVNMLMNAGTSKEDIDKLNKIANDREKAKKLNIKEAEEINQLAKKFKEKDLDRIKPFFKAVGIEDFDGFKNFKDLIKAIAKNLKKREI